jgi:hypothetical protein
MLARPLSVAFVGTLALGAAVLFGMSGCDQLDDLAHEIIKDRTGNGGASGGGTGGAAGGGAVGCASSESCPDGQICSTEEGACDQPPGCGRTGTGTGDAFVACPAVCYGVCKAKDPTPPTGQACGKTTCAAGEVCCNASCGICTPPNGGCILLACTDEPPPVPGVSCTADSDCRLEADYCTGCDCRATGLKAPTKVCSGPPVRCLVDPCMQKTAVCQSGQCVVATAPTR